MKLSHHVATVQQRFSAAAQSYERHASVQRQAASQLMELIPSDQAFTRILELGCGTGLLTRMLRQRWPESDVVAIDIAEGMIDHARQQFRDDARIHWIACDAMAYRANAPYPLVVSNCSLHWFHPLPEAIRRIASLVSSHGYVALAVMLEGTLAELHAARLHVAPHKLPLARLPAAEDLERHFNEYGLNIIHSSTEQTVVSCSSAGEILRVLHEQGLTGGLVSRSHLPLTRGELGKLASYYDDHYRQPDGSVGASYRVGFYLAQHIT